jgi:hypothetical protein
VPLPGVGGGGGGTAILLFIKEKPWNFSHGFCIQAIFYLLM